VILHLTFSFIRHYTTQGFLKSKGLINAWKAVSSPSSLKPVVCNGSFPSPFPQTQRIPRKRNKQVRLTLWLGREEAIEEPSCWVRGWYFQEVVMRQDEERADVVGSIVVHAERFSPLWINNVSKVDSHHSEDKMLYAMKGLVELPCERIKYRMNSLLILGQNKLFLLVQWTWAGLKKKQNKTNPEHL